MPTMKTIFAAFVLSSALFGCPSSPPAPPPTEASAVVTAAPAAASAEPSATPVAAIPSASSTASAAPTSPTEPTTGARPLSEFCKREGGGRCGSYDQDLKSLEARAAKGEARVAEYSSCSGAHSTTEVNGNLRIVREYEQSGALLGATITGIENRSTTIYGVLFRCVFHKDGSFSKK